LRTFSAITSRRPFTLLGILLAVLVLVAFVLVALNASQAAASPQQTVVVATRDLQPRVPITADALTTRQLPVPGNYPKVYFSAASEVLGLIPLVSIQSGQVIVSNDVVRPSQALGSQSEYLPIPQGYVALTIPTSEQQGVAGYIQPGDYITLIATVTSSSRTATKTIFTQLHVIKVGTATSTGNAASSLTVVVSQCQAEVLTWFISNTALKYSLESYHDYLSGGEPAPDPNCKQITDAKGVTLQIIQQSYPTLFPA
jgi:Flp pilus assembly protein CpaB